MAKDRITPCLYYVCVGEYKKGRQNITDAVRNVIKNQELEKKKKENICYNQSELRTAETYHIERIWLL